MNTNIYGDFQICISVLLYLIANRLYSIVAFESRSSRMDQVKFVEDSL